MQLHRTMNFKVRNAPNRIPHSQAGTHETQAGKRHGLNGRNNAAMRVYAPAIQAVNV
jgi:hypothetical protein